MRCSIVGAVLFGAISFISALVIGSSTPDLNSTEVFAILNSPGTVVTQLKSIEARMVDSSCHPTADSASPSAAMEITIQSSGPVPTIDIEAINPGWVPRHRYFGHGPAVHSRGNALPASPPPSSKEILARDVGTTDDKKSEEDDRPLHFRFIYPTNLTDMVIAAANATGNSTSVEYTATHLKTPGEAIYVRFVRKLFSLLNALNIPTPKPMWLAMKSSKETGETDIKMVVRPQITTPTPTATATTTTSSTIASLVPRILHFPTLSHRANFITITTTTTTSISMATASSTTAPLLPRKFYTPVPAMKDQITNVANSQPTADDTVAKRAWGYLPVYKWGSTSAGMPAQPTATEKVHILPRRNGRYNQL